MAGAAGGDSGDTGMERAVLAPARPGEGAAHKAQPSPAAGVPRGCTGGTRGAQEGLSCPVLQPRGAEVTLGGFSQLARSTKDKNRGSATEGTEHRVLQSWSQVNGASDKLDMVVVLDQPLPSNKAAPGAAERRVGPPKPSPSTAGPRRGSQPHGMGGIAALKPWWHRAIAPRTTRGPERPSPARQDCSPCWESRAFPAAQPGGAAPPEPPLPSQPQLGDTGQGTERHRWHLGLFGCRGKGQVGTATGTKAAKERAGLAPVPERCGALRAG